MAAILYRILYTRTHTHTHTLAHMTVKAVQRTEHKQYFHFKYEAEEGGSVLLVVSAPQIPPSPPGLTGAT